MTVEKENDHGPREYFEIKFVEFLEFIGRISWAKFKDTEKHDVWPLNKKMLNVMGFLFKFINEQPLDPDNTDDLISDSDNEY